ncbi:MAG: Hsp70 family protein [Terrimicrobiaceae bacterium]
MIAGIDLGTTNSLIGVMESGFPILLADSGGRRLLPSAVRFDETGAPIVGWDALAGRDQAVTSVKRLIGVRVGESAPVPFQVGKTGEPVRLLVGGQERSPEEISAIILENLKARAEAALSSKIERVVITVPAYFNDAQRSATKRAGELAGLIVERLLPEPTAAALAFGLGKLGDRSRVAVFDLGGGTFDISILDLQEGVFHVLATQGDTRLGGDDFDAAIAREFQIPIAEAEALKRDTALTADQQTRIHKVCQPILERTRRHCERAMLDAGIQTSDLNEVILVGGATRMLGVRKFVAGVFGREPNTSQHPDEAVAMGAVIQAGILEGSVQNVTLLDVTPLSLGIETFGGLMNIIIPRNTTIPVKAGEMFTNAVTNQTGMRISVLQGEREMASDNWKLGEFAVDFPPMPKGQARVGVQFEIDANGILHVLARDTANGKDTTLELSSAVDVSDEALEKMLADSLEHAFEDMDDRQFAEAKLKADEMLPAIEVALASVEVDPSELQAIRDAEQAVRRAIENRSLQKLKSSLARLDDATQSLAAKLMEKAMSSADENSRNRVGSPGARQKK